MKKLLISVAIVFTTLSLSGQSLKKFNKLIEEYSLRFEMPDNFHQVKVNKNDDLYYNYAIELNGDDFEVRYSIFPLRPLLEDYQSSLTDTTHTVLDPNIYYNSMFIANILNVSQAGMENMPGTSAFPTEAVMKEFGAQYGATSFFTANSEFGKKHQYCLMVVLHKDNVADIYISFLANDKESFDDKMSLAFHSIGFK